MAIVNLGTRTLTIGGTPALYTPFPFLPNQAYAFRFTPTVEFPGDVYSDFVIRPLITAGALANTVAHQVITYPVSPAPFVVLLPFSPLYRVGGDVALFVERVSRSPGFGDNAGNVTLNIIYDDANAIPTWLQ